jgi:hypothetical protein
MQRQLQTRQPRQAAQQLGHVRVAKVARQKWRNRPTGFPITSKGGVVNNTTLFVNSTTLFTNGTSPDVPLSSWYLLTGRCAAMSLVLFCRDRTVIGAKAPRKLSNV